MQPNNILKKKISTPNEVAEILMPSMRYQKQEHVKTVLLDCHNQIIKIITNNIGTSIRAEFEPREIFREAIKANAIKMILVHNHPSGDISPSTSDVLTTKKIAKFGEEIGIELLDHIIIGDGEFSSLKRMKKF